MDDTDQQEIPGFVQDNSDLFAPGPNTAPLWQDVKDKVTAAYPEHDAADLKQAYSQQWNLWAARRVAKNSQEDTGAQFERHWLPLAGTAQNLELDRRYSNSLDRFQKGAPTDDDYQQIAFHEARQQRDAAQPWYAQATQGAVKMGGEAVMTAGLMPSWLRPAAGATMGTRLGLGAVRAGVQTVATPSLGATNVVQENLAAGRHALDPQGLPKGLAQAFAQAAVFEAAGGASSKALGLEGQSGLRAAVGRTALAGVEVPFLQQGADLVGHASGLQTGYGTLGELLQGKYGEAGRKVAGEVLTGALMHGVHEGQGALAAQSHAQEAAQLLKEQAGKGYSVAVAGEAVIRHLDAQGPEPGVDRAGAPTPEVPQPGHTTDGIVPVTGEFPEQPLAAQNPPAPESTGNFSSRPPEPEAEPTGNFSSRPDVETMRAALKAVGLNAGKWGPDKVLSEASRLGLDRAEERPAQPQEPQKAATYAGPEHPNAPEVLGPYGIGDVAPALEWELKDQFEEQHPDASAEEIEALVRSAIAKQQGPWVVASTSRHAVEAGVWSRHASEAEAHRAMMQARQDNEHTGIMFRVEHREPEATVAAPTPEPRSGAPDKSAEEPLRQQLTRSKQFPDVGNTAAFHDAGPSPVMAVTDVDQMGRFGGDRTAGDAVLRGKIDALRAAGLEPFHAGQDEFLVRGQSADDLTQRLDKARELLGRSHGTDFSYGVGADPAAADDSLREQKMRKVELRAQAGQRTPLEDVIDAAGLSERERHLVRERLLGRSHEDIAGDEAMHKASGTPYTRQRIKQLEQSALKKMGLPEDFSLESVLAQERGGRAQGMLEKAQQTSAAEMHGEEPARPVKRSEAERIQAEIEAHTTAFLKEFEDAGESGLSPERLAHYTRENERLEGAYREAEGRRPAKRRGGRGTGRGTVEPAPVRRAAGAELPGGDAADGPAPADEGPGAPAPEDAGRAAAAAGGEAAGHVVSGDNGEPIHPAAEGFLRELYAAGDKVRAEDLIDILQRTNHDPADLRRALAEAKKLTPETPAPWAAKRSTKQGIQRQAEGGLRKHEVEQELWRRVAAREAATGSAPELQRGLQDGAQAANAEEPEGQGAEPVSGERPDTSFDFGANGPEGMGAAGNSGGGRGAAPGGAPGAAAPVVEDPGPRPSGSWFQAAKDWLKSFGQQSFPALTRLSATSGEKLAEATNAPAAAKASWEYFSRILKVNGVPLAEMTPDERRAVGAVWLERRMREYRDKLRSQGQDASGVGTLVGQAGSPLATEEEYQQGREALWSFWEATKQEWTKEVEKNYRGLKGLDPGDAIDSPSQIPGLPLNAIALDPEDLGKPGAVGTGPRQDLSNVRLRRPGFTRQAELSAAAYDVDIGHMMQRTLNLGIPAARRAEFVRAALADGALKDVGRGEKPPEGWKYLALDPARGLAGIDPGASYYVHPDAYRDVVQGLGIGERPGQALASGVRPVMDKLYNLALTSPVELATHMANHVTALFRSGMGVPILNLKDTFVNAQKLYAKDPEILRRVMELAKIGASFEHETRPGLLGEKLQSYDPTAYLNKLTTGFIDVMQKAVRVQMEDAFDRTVQAGLLQGGETNKRNFINQALGNYNSQSSNRIAQFLKDTGLQSFATAAHTFTAQGIKTATGGAINAPAISPPAAVQLRAQAMLKLLPFLAMGPVINSMRWGQAFPKNVPAFAVKTRDEDDGKSHYFDPLSFTGLRRGWRATGMNAAIEGSIQGKTRGEMIDQAGKDLMLSGEHLVEGPPAQFAHTLATGENALGHRVAAKAKKGESQLVQNAKAAGLNVNPVVGGITEADRPKKPRTAWEHVMRNLGPFGEQTRDKRK